MCIYRTLVYNLAFGTAFVSDKVVGSVYVFHTVHIPPPLQLPIVSPCPFDACFMIVHPNVYGDNLEDELSHNEPRCTV